jgi:hypothetical protein
LVFVIMIGPVNFMVLARPPNRHRLLFTTPIISGVAALLVLTLVLVGDGVGGQGDRAALVLIVPEDQLMLTVQSQIARTGLMFDPGMDAPKTRWVAEVGHLPGPSLRQTRVGDRLGGAWFPSRSHRAQLLEEIAQSRYRLELVEGETPTVRSSFPGALKIFYLDQAGRAWKTGRIDPGEQVALVEADVAQDYPNLPLAFEAQSSLLDRPRPGWFYAVPSSPSSSMLQGGESIRWQDSALIVGPLAKMEAR